MRQWVSGTSVTRSLPATIFRQNGAAPNEPGNSALTPTMAIGGRRVGLEACMDALTQGAWVKGKCASGDIDAGGAQLLGARDHGGAFEQVACDLCDGPIVRTFEERAGGPPVEGAHR